MDSLPFPVPPPPPMKCKNVVLMLAKNFFSFLTETTKTGINQIIFMKVMQQLYDRLTNIPVIIITFVS